MIVTPCNINNNCIYASCNNKHRKAIADNPPNVAFQGITSKSLFAFVLYKGLCCLQLIPFVSHYNPEITKNIAWTKNIQVLASTSQKYYSSYFPNEGSVYTNALIASLKGNSTKSILEAHKSLETKSGIKRGLIRHFPMSTPNNTNSWNINDKTKNRILLAISGSEKEFNLDVDNLTDEVSKMFSVPAENIIKVTNADEKSSKEGLNKLVEKLNKSDKNNTEVLIYYNGHGQILNDSIPYSSYFKKEGAEIGTTEVGIDEVYLQKFTAEKLKKVKTLIIMDTCNAGAWIAKNNPISVAYKA